MAEHGEHDAVQQKWFCGYWMVQDEWFDVHDYAPSVQKEDAGDPDED